MNVFMDDIRSGPFFDGFDSYNYPPSVSDWYDWVTVRSIENVRVLLEMGVVNKLSLDYDMGGDENGQDLVLWMVWNGFWPNGDITIHSANRIGAQTMSDTIYKHTGIRPSRWSVV